MDIKSDYGYEKTNSKERNYIIGKYYEDLATYYLTEKGYEIIERNFDTDRGEIDIICKNDEFMVFVEVKYRKSGRYGLPREAVTYAKQKKIRKAASYYIAVNKIRNMDFRFDVIEIIKDEITHLENAF